MADNKRWSEMTVAEHLDVAQQFFSRAESNANGLNQTVILGQVHVQAALALSQVPPTPVDPFDEPPIVELRRRHQELNDTSDQFRKRTLSVNLVRDCERFERTGASEEDVAEAGRIKLAVAKAVFGYTPPLEGSDG